MKRLTFEGNFCDRMKPILFNTEMVRAILDGRKTVTRRSAFPADDLRPFPHKDYPEGWWYRGRAYRTWDDAANEPKGVMSLSKYKCGDILYVRETWAHPSATEIAAGADPGMFLYKADSLQPAAWGKWRPSIHMPKEAARIFLRVTRVWVERLQDITVEDILSEGVDVEIPPICKQSIDTNFPTSEQRKKWEKMTEVQRVEYVNNRARATYIGWCDYADRLFRAFKDMWDSTIKPADLPRYGWEADPWVWVIEFERISKKEEKVIHEIQGHCL